MKKIAGIILRHWKEDFHAGQYLFIGIFLAGAIAFNYAIDFEDSFLVRLKGWTKLGGYLLFFGIPYMISILSLVVFKKQKGLLRNSRFWLFTAMGIGVLSIDSSLPYLTNLLQLWLAPELHVWSYKVIGNAISFLTIVAPLLLFCSYDQINKSNGYGIYSGSFDYKPYLTMILLMIPLLALASQMPSFQRKYPLYIETFANEYLGVDAWVTVAGYEIAYGAGFFTVEFLFRGFFVIGMAQFLGRGSVLSMCVIYCFLHFAKPGGEAISSIFGGYILGSIAYETRNIRGGFMVHVAIAWLMELFAYLAKQ